ncbi:MAG: glucokinase [Paracoccaceae bacterium]
MSVHPANTYNLVADIGGTNTRVALCDGTALLPATISKYANAQFGDLEAVLQKYLNEQGGVDCAGVCIALAGPVSDGVGRMTNLDWEIHTERLASVTKSEKTAILNDLQAQGHAIGHLAPDTLSAITHDVEPRVGGTCLVVGIGTGFNAVAVLDTPHGRLVPASEVGHAGLPVHNAQDLRLARFIATQKGFAAVEDVLSGPGLERVFRWLGNEADAPRELPAADIMAAVAAQSDARATAAAALVVRFMASIIGDIALVHLPFGGIFLVGGVARSLAPHLEAFDFTRQFRDRGRFSDMMAEFPISVIGDDNAALVGCAHYLDALN